MAIMFRGAYYPIDYYYYDEKDLYPTSDDDSCDEIEEPLTDSDCNDIVLKQQKKQIGMMMDMMQDTDHFDVYNDNEPKGDTDTDDADSTIHNYDDSLVSTLGDTYEGGDNSYSTGYYESNAESTTSGRSRESCWWRPCKHSKLNFKAQNSASSLGHYMNAVQERNDFKPC